ncbi:hypothetical protein E4T49_06575 [Aureobasidium sp. EXF-10728]|nr:hypothetical protein E4T49_06575 [Aureobasidium sp. EXF-10728]
MRSITLIAGLAVLAVASAAPQVFDPDQLTDVPAPPVSDVPIGAGTEIIPLDENAVVADAVAAIIADPSPDIDASIPAAISKRSTRAKARRTTGTCAPQPVGYGPLVSPDTASAFQNYPDFAAAATNAPLPSGYDVQFTNQWASVSACSYQGYKTYKSYDVNQAAADCNNIKGCKGFNIFFERDPSVDPGYGCDNPASTTVIKVSNITGSLASFWGNVITAASATNKGQYRDNFQVVIAGSNAYNVKQCRTDVYGWTQTQLGDCSINAPATPCAPDGKDAYLTMQTFPDGNFDNNRCKAQCDIITGQSSKTPCNFFTSYMSVQEGKCGIQVCAFYKRAFDSSYCTNKGDPVNKITNKWASSFTNQANDGSSICPITKPVYFRR